MQTRHVDKPKTLILRFKSDFFLRCALYIAPLLTIDSWHFCLWNFTKISLMWLHAISGMIRSNENCNMTALLSRKLFKFYALKVRSYLLLRCKISLANSMNFHRNLYDWEFHASAKKFAKQILLLFKLVTWIRHADQQITALFESDYCVSCALYIATLLTKRNIYAKLR